MRAVRVHEHGDPSVLSIDQLPIPEPGPGQVRIRVAYAALNHLDTWVRRGVPGHKFPLPLTLGSDFSGVVDACGEGTTLEMGARVVAQPGYSCGACEHCLHGRQPLCARYGIRGESCDGGEADYAIIDQADLVLLPDNFPLDLAAAYPLTFLTAWHMLVGRCGIRPGDRVLIHAAGSGVSVAALQIAKLWGAEVAVTAGTDTKLLLAKEQGAALGIHYRDQDWVAIAKEWSGRGGIDIIVDHVGAETLPGGVGLLAKGGRIVTCGTTSGPKTTLNFAPIFFKGLSILGSTMGSPGELLELSRHVFAGRLTPVIDSIFPLADVREAHDKMARRDLFGKILLKISDKATE